MVSCNHDHGVIVLIVSSLNQGQHVRLSPAFTSIKHMQTMFCLSGTNQVGQTHELWTHQGKSGVMIWYGMLLAVAPAVAIAGAVPKRMGQNVDKSARGCDSKPAKR